MLLLFLKLVDGHTETFNPPMFPSSHLPQFQDNTVSLRSESWLILSLVEQQTLLENLILTGLPAS